MRLILIFSHGPRRALRAGAAVALAAVLAAACGGGAGPASGGVTVVAGFYPLAEAARAVAGERAAVHDLTPPGGDAHGLELTTRDVDLIAGADVVVLLGRFQPALADAAARSDGTVVDVAADDAGEHEGDEHADEEHAEDEHAEAHPWLDPKEMAEIVSQVAAALAAADPGAASAYRARAEAARRSLADLDGDFERGLASCERTLVVTAHDAFGALERYGLRTEAIAGAEHESEPNAARLDELAALVRETGTTTIFIEPGAPPEAGETLARETGAAIASLHPLESLTERQRAAGATYESVMRENLEALRAALGCGAP